VYSGLRCGKYADPFRAAIADLSRSVSRLASRLVLVVAGAVAALAAVADLRLCPFSVETAPFRLRAAPETATPEFLDY